VRSVSARLARPATPATPPPVRGALNARGCGPLEQLGGGLPQPPFPVPVVREGRLLGLLVDVHPGPVAQMRPTLVEDDRGECRPERDGRAIPGTCRRTRITARTVRSCSRDSPVPGMKPGSNRDADAVACASLELVGVVEDSELGGGVGDGRGAHASGAVSGGGSGEVDPGSRHSAGRTRAICLARPAL
jgi:hypothetical protein